jgi:hypothetical protein
MRGGYTQDAAVVSQPQSKRLVNERSNKVVNIASTKMVKRILAAWRCTRRYAAGSRGAG